MAGETALRTSRQLNYGAGQLGLGQQAMQQSLLNYLMGGPGATPQHVRGYGANGGGMFPGGMTLEQMGFTGEVVPSAGPMLSQAFGNVGGFTQSPEYMARTNTANSLLNAGPTFQANPALREQYFRDAIERPAMDAFHMETMPAIAARFGRGGNIGAASYAGGQAASGLLGQLAGQRAGLMRDDEVRQQQAMESMYGRQANAMGLSYQNQVQPLSLLGTFGGMERDIRGAQNSQRLQEAYMGQPFGDPRLSLLSLLGGGAMTTPGQVSAPQAGGGGAGWMQLASKILDPAGIAGMVGGLF